MKHKLDQAKEVEVLEEAKRLASLPHAASCQTENVGLADQASQSDAALVGVRGTQTRKNIGQHSKGNSKVFFLLYTLHASLIETAFPLFERDNMNPDFTEMFSQSSTALI